MTNITVQVKDATHATCGRTALGCCFRGHRTRREPIISSKPLPTILAPSLTVSCSPFLSYPDSLVPKNLYLPR